MCMPRLVVCVVKKASAAKPSSTKLPAPRFKVLDLRMAIVLLQKR